MINFCTLFDSSYIDKGIALYESLEKYTNDFCLYIFCFDEKTYRVLLDINFKNAIIINIKQIEDDILLKKKKERSRAEYCWTCTPIIIEHVLLNYKVKSCTYIDSDIFFFGSPEILIKEIEDNNADVCIVPHRFNNDSEGRRLEDKSGKYCVEFNYFKNNRNGLSVLRWWKNKCLDWCFDISEVDRMGDQKYLCYFETNFENVYILDNLGGGVAPWNIKQYKLVSNNNGEVILNDKNIGDFKLIFYHFQNIRYFNKNYVNIKSMTNDVLLKSSLYYPYLKIIEEIRDMLRNKYDICFHSSKLGLSSNQLLGFLQSNFAAYKIRYLSDIVNLNKIRNNY